MNENITTLEFKIDPKAISNGIINTKPNQAGLEWSITAEARKIAEYIEIRRSVINLLLSKGKTKEYRKFKEFIDEKIDESVENISELLEDLGESDQSRGN